MGRPRRGRATEMRSAQMSTYLVAMFVADGYTSVSARTSTGTLVRVWAPDTFNASMAYALSVATTIMPYYEALFAQPFPLPKQDLVGIPDFAAGAMENWCVRLRAVCVPARRIAAHRRGRRRGLWRRGMITFRLSALLYGAESSAYDMLSVGETVSHELAHQVCEPARCCSSCGIITIPRLPFRSLPLSRAAPD